MASLLSSSLYTIPLLMRLRLPLLRISAKNRLWYFVIPLGCGKALASACAHFSIWKVPISFAHTSKSESLFLDLPDFLLFFQ